MNLVFVMFLLLNIPEAFSRFTYCRDNSRGPFEKQCVVLNPQGTGDVDFKRREAEPIHVGIQLSPAAKERFLTVLAATNGLQEGDSYESNRKVADLGRKTLTLEMASGKRQATFNYSARKEVIDLVAFFEGLINQETLGFDIETALRFERLSIPKRLEQMENEIRANRIADPERLIPVLEKIENDQRLMNFARTRAGSLKKQLQAKK